MRHRGAWVCVGAAWLASAVAGCGSSAGASTTDAGAGDAANDAGAGDAPAGDMPAARAHAPLPLVDYLGGPILAAPKVVTVTWGTDGDPAADPRRAFLEAYDDAITTTPWWDAVRAGFCDQGAPPTCVGRGTSGGHVHLTDAPAASYDDGPTGGSLRDLMQGYLTSGVFPAPDADTVYVIFFRPGTTITADGFAVSCQQFFGYHASFEATLPGGGAATVPYVVVPRCSTNDEELTTVVSHELIETATDPVDPDPALGGTAYSMTADTVWPVFGDGSEVADLCLWTNDNSTTMEGAYLVSRSWSNLAAAAGHDPCVPAPAATPYFNVAPAADKLSLAVGASTTLDLDAFSDGPTADWNVSVVDVSGQVGGTAAAATFTLDRPTANAGTRVHMTITMNRAAPAAHPTFLMLTSQSAATIHRWPVAVTSN